MMKLSDIPDKKKTKKESAILEMGDKPQKVTKWSKHRNAEIAHFKAGDYNYQVWFSKWSYSGENATTIEFALVDEEGDINPRKNKIGLEKTGEAVKVFATVIDIIKKWINKNKPSAIEFEASGDSRRKLYGHFVKKIAPTLGYKLDGDIKNAVKWGNFRLVHKDYKDPLENLKKKK